MSDTEENGEGRRRSRRQVPTSSKKNERMAALEKMQKARSEGRKYRVNVEELDQPLYDEVPEEEFQQREQERSEFVEGGYGSEEEWEDDASTSASTGSRKKSKEKKEKKKGGLYDHFAPAAQAKGKPQDDAPVNLDEDQDLMEMLGQIGNTPHLEVASSNPFGFAAATPPAAPRVRAANSGLKVAYPAPSPFDDEPSEVRPRKVLVQQKRPAAELPTDAPTPKQAKCTPQAPLEVDEADDFGGGGFDDEPMDEEPVLPPSPEGKKPEGAGTSERPSKSTTPPADFTTFAQFEGNPGDEQAADEQPAEGEPSDKLRMYWIETFEDPYKNPGVVYLFGRMNGKSCCIVARNIEHKVYFVPREFDENGNADFTAIHGEVQDKFAKGRFFNMDGVKGDVLRVPLPKLVKYVPTDDHTPREMNTLMVLYKGHLPKIPATAKGDTFGHVLNTTATAMERLLLETKLRGPCWIEISNAVDVRNTDRASSHCELEFTVNMGPKGGSMANIRPLADPPAAPPVSLLSLFVCGAASNEKETEIVMIACLIRRGASLDGMNGRSYEDPRRYEAVCFVAPPKKGALPISLEADLKRANIPPNSVVRMPNERAMLSAFFARFKQLNPDVLVAHDFTAQLQLLMSRVEKHNVQTWHFIGRLNRNDGRSKRDGALSRLLKTKAGQWELMAGRSVLCSKTAAEELFPTRSYELGDLLALLAPEKQRSACTAAQILEPFTSIKPERTIPQLVQWAWNDAFFSLLLVIRLSALPLFVQITQIVGGVLSRTLLGGRAERNEYLLLHAFHEQGFVPPDKRQAGVDRWKNGQKALKGEEEEESKTQASKKAQYTGGLVLEPKKGFYDHYIVLLDFNSLYPSIIQEFNICFTTIPRCYEEPDENGLPEPPKDSAAEGILPTEISKLVRNRRDVKNQMKRVRAGSDEYMKLDVRQKGLKLTANSMYGCLGFNMSRFCAKTLAAMITSKGRELLSRTKEIVEKRGFVVVYGDTDSIMVSTNTPNYNDARRLAEELRKIVNGGFKHVEMDVDGLFKRMLLLKKKKYAALAVSLKSETDVKREMKGLDIVRRDWSTLARDVGEQVVDLILRSSEREELVNEVVRTLSEVAEAVKAHKIPMEKFEILKQLTKPPKEYADTKAQPHVHVALRMNESKKHTFRAGDVIKYVICEDGTTNSAMQRAYHLDEIKENENLAVDVHYYLSQQVHPVVMRLCEPFAELDACRIAEALGLDSATYRHRTIAPSGEGNLMDSLADAMVAFDVYEGFKFECPECDKPVVVRSTFAPEKTNMSFALESCPECQADLSDHFDHLQSLLLRQLNDAVKRYAACKFVCEDPTCGYREEEPLGLSWASSHGPACPQCKAAVMRKEFSLKDLFYQQKFYKSIFDWKACLKNFCSEEQRKAARNRVTFNNVARFYDQCEASVLQHMNANRYNRVQLDGLLRGFRIAS